jgi:phosphoribosyl 1,2-cyclic phosphodiesterase
MDVFFRSYRSSSAGNCLAVWTPGTSLLIDFGVRTLRDCREILRVHRASHGPVDGVLVTHAHRDHLSPDAVRVLQEEGIPVYAHRFVMPQLLARDGSRGVPGPEVRALPGDRFTFGDFEITAIGLPHAPGFATFGFAVEAGRGANRRKLVVATDFHEASTVRPHLDGADFVFVEANHDLDLLRQHPNPNSRYHLSNVKTARLLFEAFGDGHGAPRMVVLGHLSEQRNRARLAVEEVERAFAAQGVPVPFALDTAPRREASRVLRVG